MSCIALFPRIGLLFVVDNCIIQEIALMPDHITYLSDLSVMVVLFIDDAYAGKVIKRAC